MATSDEQEPRGRRRRRDTIVSTVRRSAKLWGFLAFAILILVLARKVLIPFVFAVLLAYILAPLVRRMSERADGSKRMPRGVAILICYLVVLAVSAVFAMLMMPKLAEDAQQIAKELPAAYKRIDQELVPRIAKFIDEQGMRTAPPPVVPEPAVVADVPVPPGTVGRLTPLPDQTWALQLEKDGVEVMPRRGGGVIVKPRSSPVQAQTTEEMVRESVQQVMTYFQSEIGNLFSLGRKLISKIVLSIFNFFIVLMVAAFILIDMEKVHRFVRSLFPSKYRDDYDDIISDIDVSLSGVIRGQLIICCVNGVLTYIGLLIFDVKYSLILACVAALLSLIPIFGSILSTIPIVLAAFVSGGEGIDVMRGVFITLWIIGIHFIEANLLNPKIIGTTAKIHPVVVIFALLAGERTYGLTGALLAVPAASIIQVVFLYVKEKSWRNPRAATADDRTGLIDRRRE